MKKEDNKAENVIKSENWNAKWGEGDLTCIHTLNDKDGAWWKGSFGMQVTVTRVQILNRLDDDGKNINGAQVMVGDN